MKLLIRKFKTIEDTYKACTWEVADDGKEDGEMKFVEVSKKSEFEIPFSISGGNGVGKSTLLEAISFVLTGKDLNGNEFRQVYDNRVDLHNAIADASFFDDYGNEFNRIVKPVFETKRDGIERVKTLRNTTCKKNSIPCNDFAPEFSDFFKFGTDYFFRQKEDVQRSIFIDLLKSKMPDYDIKEAVEKKKMFENAEKTKSSELKKIKIEIKDKKDVAVPVIPAELEAKNKEYLTLKESDNSDMIEGVNKRNNKALKGYFSKKSSLLESESEHIGFVKASELNILEYSKKLESVKESKFEAMVLRGTAILEERMAEAKKTLESITWHDSINDYAVANFNKNPILVENSAKITALKSNTFEYLGGNESDYNCPISGSPCETASKNSIRSAQIKFDNSILDGVNSLKAENRKILEKEYNASATEYFTAKSRFSSLQTQIQVIESEDEAIAIGNEKQIHIFEKEKDEEIKSISDRIELEKSRLESLKSFLDLTQKGIESLQEPELEKLPESIEISGELKDVNARYREIEESIIGAKAVNANNAKEKAEKEEQIKKIQENLLYIVANITTLKAEISEYFSNLKGIISEEFKGDILIDVELLEFVMASGEYKDCFKVTANGKVFPYECNGALQNNTKLQILANMQRLVGYNGVTVIDNCEANTTQPINTLNLKCVTAFATNEKLLTIK